MKKHHIYIAIASFLLFLLTSAYSHETRKDFTSLEAQISKETLSILDHAELVSVFSVEPRKGPLYYSATSPEHLISDELKTELRKLLLNDKSYVYGINKRSLFEPSIAFKFYKNDVEFAVVLFSISNNQIRILNNNQSCILNYDPVFKIFNKLIIEIENQYL